MRRNTGAPGLAALVVLAALTPAPTQTQPGRRPLDDTRGRPLDDTRGRPFDLLHFRAIGPAATGGRIHDLQIDPKDPAILYVGTATGGIWKSTNKGVTWKDIFGNQPDNTFGALAIFEGNPGIVWAGTGENNNRQSSSWGGGVYRSTDGGETWTYLGLHDTRSINRDALEMMGILNKDIKLSRNDGDNISEISNFAESPVDPRILWVETDDGNVQLTTDGGATWNELSGAITGVKNGTFVGDIVASAASRGTAYVSFDAHRDGDFAPYIFRTADFGKTWTAVTTGLPADDASIRGLAEFPGHPNVLFAGTERALFVTHDSGGHWTRLTANLPTTRYDDIVIHPRTRDLILGTHGRGIYVLDDASPIAEWTPAVAAKRAHLFAVPRATLMLYWEDVSNMNHYFFTAENPAEGAAFTYHLAQPAQKVRLIVTTPAPRLGSGQAGKVIREVTGPGEAGVIHRVNWDCRYPVPPGVGRGGAGGGGEEGGGGFGPGTQKPGVMQLPIPSHEIGPRGPHVAPGTFTVTLEVDGVPAESRTFEVRGDPASAVTLTQHKAREAFVVEVMELLTETETLATDLSTRRKAATGEEATRLQALELRLVGGDGGRGGGRGSGAQPLRQRLGGLINAFVGSGARTGTMAQPTATMRAALAEAKADLAALEKEIKK